MKRMKRWATLTSLALLFFIAGGAFAFVIAPDVPGFDGRLRVGPFIEIFEDPTPYSSGMAAEVFPPDSSNPLATEPYIAYEGGAFVVRYYNQNGSAYKLRIGAGGKSGSYTLYTDNSTYRIPLIYGQGDYTISVTEVVSGSNYRTVATKQLSTNSSGTASASVSTEPATSADSPAATTTESKWNIDTSNPYLTPVVDINWSENLTSVKKARELCADATSDKEKARIVYNHLVSRMSYVYSNKSSGYTPDMDSAYASKSGICYDMASLYAGMLRSVGVQAKMVTGYNTMVEGYHAWNEIYYDNAWHRVDLSIDCQLREYGNSYGFESPKGSVTVTKSY